MSDEAAWEKAVRSAQGSLDVLREYCDLPNAADMNPCVLTRVEDGGQAADLWLTVLALDGADFVATVGELPEGFAGLAPGDALQVTEADVLDWVVNDDGDLHGGFSLRLERARLPEAERVAYDQALGARRYV